MQTDIDPRSLIGRKAFDRNGTKIGTVDEVYLDDATGEPEWAAVRTGLFSRDAFVPLEPSELVGRRAARPVRTRPDQGRPGLRRRPPPLPRAGAPALPPLRPGRARRRPDPRDCRRATSADRRTSATRWPGRTSLTPRSAQRRRGGRATSGSGSAGSSAGSSTAEGAHPARRATPAPRTARSPGPPRCPAPTRRRTRRAVRPGPARQRRSARAPAPRRRRSAGPRRASSAGSGSSASAAACSAPARLGEQVLLGVVGEPADARPRAAGPRRWCPPPPAAAPAASRTTAGSSVGAAQRLGAGQRREVVPPHLEHDGAPRAPRRRAAAARSGRRAASTSSRTRTRSVRSTSKVSSTETDLASRSATTGRSSTPSAIAYSDVPVRLAQQPHQLGLARLRDLADGGDPGPPQVLRRWPVRPRAGCAPDIGASSSRSVPGSMTTRPSGLACSEAILASILEPASPTEPVSPVDRPDVRPQPLADRRAERLVRPTPPGLQVDEGLVQAERLHQRRQPPAAAP